MVQECPQADCQQKEANGADADVPSVYHTVAECVRMQALNVTSQSQQLKALHSLSLVCYYQL